MEFTYSCFPRHSSTFFGCLIGFWKNNRDLTLKPVARVFDAKIKAMRPSRTDDAQQLKGKADSLAEIKRQLELLDEACPIWPLHTKRLRIVLVTAVLPVVVPIVTAVIAHLLDR